MKILYTLALILIYGFLSAQSEVVTTLSTLIYDKNVALNQKDKRTHSKTVDLIIPEDFVKQFERIDAVFLSYWIGSGQFAKDHYEKDCSKKLSKTEMDLDPVIFYAQNNAGLFTYPKSQTGFGTEISLFEFNTDSLKLAKYRKKRIQPKGIFPNLIMRNTGTTAVNFTYRFPLFKKMFLEKKNMSYKLLLRTSSKSDTVSLDVRMVLTIQGKRHQMTNAPEMNKFIYDAVIQGLNGDGFPINHAKWIAENKSVFFVNKCRICANVAAAFKDYISENKISETKISTELLDKLAKGEREEKLLAFAQIINKYITLYYEKLNLNEREKTKLESELLLARKEGMSLKKIEFGDFCPSCDGTCCKVKK